MPVHHKKGVTTSGDGARPPYGSRFPSSRCVRRAHRCPASPSRTFLPG